MFMFIEIVKLIEADVARRYKRESVNATIVDSIPTQGNKICTIFSFLRSDNLENGKLGRYVLLLNNALRIRQKMDNASVLMRTKNFY